MTDNIEDFGAEPMCKVMQIAPSTFRRRRALALNPDLRSDRAKKDEADLAEIKRVYDKQSGQVYGSRKVWHHLKSEGKAIAKCTVERLMRQAGYQGLVRGKPVITTNPDARLPCPEDRVNRAFSAQRPNQLWVCDFTYVKTWSGNVFVAFVIDVFARRIVGWKVSTSMTTRFVLDALEQALHQRRPVPVEGKKLIHHSDRGSQYMAFKYSDRLEQAGVDMSVGSVGDSYENALAESTIGLFKTEVTKRMGPWKSMGPVEWETAKWVKWYNTKRLHSAINYQTPSQKEETYLKETHGYELAA